MEIDITIDNKSLSINIEDPHKFDAAQVIKSIMEFGAESGVDLGPFEIDKLIPRMIRGVAGCEGGCPADAQGLVRTGFKGFKLSYIEGGILSAVDTLENGKTLSVKVFPEF